MTPLSAIVVSYNTRDHLLGCVEAVVDSASEVIVVDNASSDGSAAAVGARFPDVNVIRLDENLGFGTACNVGIATATAPLLLVLNADAIPEPGAIAALVGCASRHPEAGAIGPLLVGPDDRAQESTNGYPSRWWLGRPAMTSYGRRTSRASSSDDPYRPIKEGFVAGAALLLRREAIDDVGAFDPRFFMFYEDVDLCRRLEHAGWGVGTCTDARVRHVGGAATRLDWPTLYAEQLASHLRYLNKHEGRRAAAVARAALIVSVAVRWLTASGERRDGYRAGVNALLSRSAHREEESTPLPAAAG